MTCKQYFPQCFIIDKRYFLKFITAYRIALNEIEFFNLGANAFGDHREHVYANDIPIVHHVFHR